MASDVFYLFFPLTAAVAAVAIGRLLSPPPMAAPLPPPPPLTTVLPTVLSPTPAAVAAVRGISFHLDECEGGVRCVCIRGREGDLLPPGWEGGVRCV